MKVSKVTTCNVSYILFILYAFFSDLFQATIRAGIYRYILWAGIVGLMVFSVVNNHKWKVSRNLLFVAVIVLFFVCFRNQALSHGDKATTLRWLYCFVFVLFAVSSVDSTNTNVIKYVAHIGFINVLATYFFWMVPSAYKIMHSVWEYWPTGTANGKTGYKAALTNHYSHNGIVLAVTAIALFAIVMSRWEQSEKRSFFYKVKTMLYGMMFALSCFAIVLTSKRAHLLFGIMAMIVVYYLCNPQKIAGRTFKVIVGGIFAGIAVYIASFYVPEINQVLSRFSSVGEDSTMQSRFEFWGLALSMFLKNPILGNGWLSFRYNYNSVLYQAAVESQTRSARYELIDTHNVYLQVLAETGIVGFLLYICIVAYLLKVTFTLLQKYRGELRLLGLEAAIFFSAAIQVFFILYSCTGNCLYDITFAFYCISAIFTLGCKNLLEEGYFNAIKKKK